MKNIKPIGFGKGNLLHFDGEKDTSTLNHQIFRFTIKLSEDEKDFKTKGEHRNWEEKKSNFEYRS